MDKENSNLDLHNKIIDYVYNNNGYIYGSYVYNYILKNKSFNDINIAIPKYMIQYRKFNEKIEEPIINKFMEKNNCSQIKQTSISSIFDIEYKCPNGLIYTMTQKEKVNKYINTDKTDIVYGLNGLFHKRYPHDPKALTEAIHNYMNNSMNLYKGDNEHKADIKNIIIDEADSYNRVHYGWFNKFKSNYQELIRKLRNN